MMRHDFYSLVQNKNWDWESWREDDGAKPQAGLDTAGLVLAGKELRSVRSMWYKF